jgi:hypothetical protein
MQGVSLLSFTQLYSALLSFTQLYSALQTFAGAAMQGDEPDEALTYLMRQTKLYLTHSLKRAIPLHLTN